ncbi:MAG: hypothetical protein WCT27_03250 [Patescibacteria group bacterium]
MIGAAVLVVLFIGAVVWWLVTRQNAPVINQANTNTVTQNADVVIINTVTNQAAVTNAAVTDEVALVRLANLFTERYGSYSTEASFKNITDLKVYMTKKMQVVSDSFVTAQKSQSSTGSFLATTTSALSTRVDALTAAKATISVSTQRRETGTNINGTNTYYQVLILDFAKEGGAWLIDNATWQAKGSL